MSSSHPTFVDRFTRPVEIRPEHTALIVVDMQNATGNRKLGLGRMLHDEGRSESASYRFDRIEKLLIPNIARLSAAFRQSGARVVYITYGSELEDYSDMPAHMLRIVEATRNREGCKEHEIVDELKPEPGDLVLNKKTMGAFGSTGIDTNLRAMGIETVVVVGVSTNNCVAMTAMEACDHQYGVVIVSDATGTDSDEMQDATLTMLRRLWGRVNTTDEVIEELTGSGAKRATG
jgi:nicotinamidase-related amidase